MQMWTAAQSSTRVLSIHERLHVESGVPRLPPEHEDIYILFIPRHTHYDTMLEKGLLDSPRSNVAYLGLYSRLSSFLRCVFV
jgi:hypothetical protein